MAEVIILAKMPNNPKKKRRILTEQEIAFIKLSFKRLSYRQMGEHLGVSQTTVCVWCGELKLVKKPYIPPNQRAKVIKEGYFNVDEPNEKTWII